MKFKNGNMRMHSYFEGLKSKVFKILHLFDERNPSVNTYIASLLSELDGLVNMAEDIDMEFKTVFATLEELYNYSFDVAYFENTDEFIDNPLVKREIFKCMTLIECLQEKAD